MPILGPEHDYAHPVEPDGAWSESYYFNAYDPVTDTGLFTRIGVRPNEGTMDVGLSVWLPGSGMAPYHYVAEQHEMVDRRLEVGGVVYEMLEPMERWRITAELESISVDVTFEALIPAVGVDAQGRSHSGSAASTAASVGKGHLEQAGRWTGAVVVDGARHEWGDARGNRDKSWGPRRWGGPKMWRWFSINIGDDVHFGGIRIGTDAGDLHRGWVWKDGAHCSIREWQVKTELEEDGITHRRTHVVAVDKADRRHELTAELMRVAGLPQRTGTIVNEGLARWEYEGATGYGIAEYLHQLDESGRSLVPIE